MDKVFIVKVRNWDEQTSYSNFSFHRTKEGADKAVAEAKRRYSTDNAWVDEETVVD